MARIRTIKPTLWQSEQLGRVAPLCRLLFIGLISQADDDGRQRGAAALVKSLVFPYDDLAVAEVDRMLAALAQVGLIVRYQHDGASYIAIPTFADHQAINRKTDSTLPAPPDQHGLTEDSLSAHGALTDDSRPEGKGREGKTTPRARTHEAPAAEAARPAAPPPTRAELVAEVARIVAPLGRPLTEHQTRRAERALVEHGADVLAYLVGKARGPGVDRPVAVFVGFLAPESDALVEAVEACQRQRADAQMRAADVERVLALKAANGIEV